MNSEFELIAKTFQGLEEVLAKELTEIGATNIELGRRMVSFTGDKRMMYKANIALRTAIRILKPLKHFTAKDADDVYDAVKSIDWAEYMDEKTNFSVDAVVFSNEFRHSKFVAYRVKDAIVDYFREKTGERPSVRINNPDLRLNIHIAETQCTLSLDSSGESLHRRGYRQEQVEAPLNEVLAAGMILLSGWRGETDLIDPMCGSGTIPIEAALIARNIAPGIFRKEFGFEKWKDYDEELFQEVYHDDSEERPFHHTIYGYDINQYAYQIASNNVKAAGLNSCIKLAQRPFEEFERPAEKAIIITNPPYGERITTDDLLGFYKLIGQKFKHQFAGNTAWVLSYRDECFDQIGLKPSEKIFLYNGALECQFRKYELFDGKYNAFRSENPRPAFRTPREERPYERKERKFESSVRSFRKDEKTFGRKDRDFRREDRKWERNDKDKDEKERSFRKSDRKPFERRDGGFRKVEDRTYEGKERKWKKEERKSFRGETSKFREQTSVRPKPYENERPKRPNTDDGRPKRDVQFRYLHPKRRTEDTED